MRYHDYHLDSYTISDTDRTITLNLSLGEDISFIEFRGVSFHHFTHTEGTILLELEELPLRKFIDSKYQQIEAWNQVFGVRDFVQGKQAYIDNLEQLGLKVWGISSSIGFTGFVLCKEVLGNDA